ncbi:MAG: FAD-dependent oxidoreductase [Elusimicrobia bacterium]|nr:FAD-dependent oxidoreductase [Elusimicrobiota bacterium]
MKVIIVGGVAGGASCAARLRRLDEGDQITVFERDENVSFSNCSLPYYLSGVVEKSETLVMMSPKKFLTQYNINVRTMSEVTAINRKSKTVTVLDRTKNTTYEESYDKLVLSPGAAAIVPPIPGIELVNKHEVRNVGDVVGLKQSITPAAGQKMVVIGGGFIGVEVAENLREAGYAMTLVEAMPQILRIYDADMVQLLHKSLDDHGIELVLNDKVASFEKNTVVLGSGRKIKADGVVMAIGVTPETRLAKAAGLTLGATGAIAVDAECRTNDPDIYAIGDAIEVDHAFLKEKFKIALAWPAQIQARGVANSIKGLPFTHPAYIASSCIKVFEYNAASTGLTEEQIKQMKSPLSYDVALVSPQDIVGIMPNSTPVFLKVIFEKPSGRLLGAQAISKGAADKRIDVIATAIHFNATIRDLMGLELCYAPPFSTAKDVTNMAGYVGRNLLDGTFKQVLPSELRSLVASGAYILDVREDYEVGAGVVRGSKNIPLSQLRGRVSEIPKDRPVYAYCRSGQRSYNAVLALQNLGYTQVYNLAGGYMFFSFNEYMQDRLAKRESVLTGYNFN